MPRVTPQQLVGVFLVVVLASCALPGGSSSSWLITSDSANMPVERGSLLARLEGDAMPEDVDAAPSPFVGTMAASLDTWTDFSFVSLGAKGQAVKLNNLTEVGGVLPMEAAYVAHRNAVAFLSIGASSYASLVSATTGQLLGHWTYVGLVLTNIEYDVALKAVFVIGYDSSQQRNALYRLSDVNGSLTMVAVVPGIVQVSESTYCPISHTFFCTVQTDSGSMNALVRVSVTEGRTLPAVPLVDSVEMLFWDYTSGDGVLYALIATETQAALLVTIDPATGKRNATLGSGFTNLSSNPNNGASAALNLKSKQLTGCFVDISTGNLDPYWIVMDARTGKASAAAYAYGYATNILVNAPQ